MGHYPAWPGSQSYLRVACIFNHSTAGSGDFVSSTFTIHDFANAVWHNGAGRTVVTPGGNTATTIPINDCRGMGTWVNRTITGTGIPARTFVTAVAPAAGCAAANPAAVPGTLTVNKALVPAAVVAGTLLVENSQVRSVTDATLQVASPQITSTQANFTGADNGCTASGTNIDNPAGGYVGGTLAAAAGATADIGSANITPGANQTVTICGTLEVTTTRTTNDASFPATNQISSGTSATTGARFQTSDVGLQVFGPAIIQPCYILTRNSATLVTLTHNCNTGAPGATNVVTIGVPSRTAPQTTNPVPLSGSCAAVAPFDAACSKYDTVLNQGVQLPLSPTLVAGSADCTDDQSAGFGIEGSWLNPGSFQGGAFATQPPGTKAIGEIFFATSVINYGAYVVETVLNGVDPLISPQHYNIVFPNVPTTLALCPSTPTSPGLGFSIGVNGTTVSQAAIPNGVGRPGTSQLRNTRATNAGSASTVYITDDINGPGVNWTGSQFNRFCSIPTGPPVINFVCGDG